MQQEKRRFLNLRRAANEAQPHHKDAMLMMAKMLEPDQLAKVDEKLAEHYFDMTFIRVLVKRGIPQQQAEAIVSRSRLPTERIPKAVLQTQIDRYRLSGKTIGSLHAAGIRTAGDFALKSKDAHIKAGVGKEAVEETTIKLMEQGIRTVDNPPPVRA